jgi:Ribosomal protein S1
MELETDVSKKNKTKEFENLLNEDFKKREFKEGKIIKATVSEIGKKFIFVETGLKSEGAIPIEEFKISKELEKLKVGSKIDVYLEKIESYRTGEIVVSREKAKRMGSWEKMTKAFENQTEVEGVIVNKVRGGFVVNIDSCLCFLPGSQVDTKPIKNMDSLMNTPQKFLCVKLDKSRGNIVVSRKAVLSKFRDKELGKILSSLKEGMGSRRS